MNSHIIILIVIILVIFYITSQSDNKSTLKIDNSMILCLLLVGLLVFFIYRDFNKKTEAFFNNNYRNLYNINQDKYIKPWSNNRTTYADLDRKQPGNYPGIFKKKCYKNSPSKKVRFNLTDKTTIHSPVGSPHQLTEDITSSNFPTVDGQPNSARHMFMFAKNQAHPECCPSIYSTDRGCLCLTQEQENYLQSRGRNKPYNTNPNI